MAKPWFCQDCRVVMLYNDKLKCHICPQCKTEVWPPNKADVVHDEMMSLMIDMQKNHKPRECMPMVGGRVKGGGSKSGKRSKSEKMKKDTLSTLNNKLYKET